MSTYVGAGDAGHEALPGRGRAGAASAASAWIVAAGRVLYTAIFIVGALGNFSQRTIAFAAQEGVPLAQIAVPLAGVIALAGGMSVLFGYRAKSGAWLLVLFLVPVTLRMHAFWTLSDPAQAEIQQIMFMKNVSMLGAALLVSQFGAGPLSLDGRRSP
jgi:putative oxidoreductase